jgi:hypothetical protein
MCSSLPRPIKPLLDIKKEGMMMVYVEKLSLLGVVVVTVVNGI